MIWLINILDLVMVFASHSYFPCPAIFVLQSIVLTVCFICFDIWCLVSPGDTIPTRASWFLNRVTDWPVKEFFYIQANPSRTHRPSSLFDTALILWDNIPKPISSQGQAFTLLDLLKLFKVVNPKLGSLSRLLLPAETKLMALAHISPCFSD